MKLIGIIILSLISVIAYGQSENKNDLSIDTSSFVITPNPFLDSTAIKFNMVSNDTTSLIVYSMIGQVDTLYFQDSLLSIGQYNFKYQTDIDGMYLVRLTVGNDVYIKKVIKTDSLNFVLEHFSVNNLSIFPNPTTGLIRINNDKLKIMNVAVYDIYGKEVKSIGLLSLSKCEINLGSQPKGIYIIKVQTSRGVAIEKVVLE